MFERGGTHRRSARIESKIINQTETTPVTPNEQCLLTISPEKFDVHYDDSSDEEDVDDKIQSYDINQSWERFQNHRLMTIRNSLNNDELLSFVAHSSGLKLLYSKNVNTRYYAEKQNLLTEADMNNTALLQLKKLVKQEVLSALNEGLHALQLFTSINKKKESQKKVIHSLSTTLKAALESNIDNIIQSNMNAFILFIKKNQYWSEIDVIPELDQFKHALTEFLNNTISSLSVIKKSSDHRAKHRDVLLELMKSTINELFSKLKLEKKENAEGKAEAINLLSNYKGQYKHLAMYLKSLLEYAAARGIVQNIIAAQMQSAQILSFMLRAYINDLASCKNLSKNEDSALKKLYAFHNDYLCDEITSSFALSLHSHIQNLIKNFYRPVLGKNFLFASNNPFSFYANLRLSNRSQKRQILNLQHAPFMQDQAARAWRLTDSVNSATDVNEHQEILAGSFGRRDLVDGLSNYEKINGALDDLKDYFNEKDVPATDKDIAIWIRSIFNGKMPAFELSRIDTIVIQHKLQAITYLLFGCESTRNPAMSIINQMILDLIIDNKGMSFEEAFTGDTFMPMMPEGAVAAARALETRYRKFMPYPYCYRGAEDNSGKDSSYTKKDLIKSEAKIVRAWLQQQPDFQANSKTPLTEQISSLIDSHINTWMNQPTTPQLQGQNHALR